MSRMEPSPSLLNLPDDVICVLLRYLDATSLYFLSKTCIHLDILIKDHFTLWKRIDTRRAPYSRDKINYCVERCYDVGNSWTEAFLLRGDSNETPPRSFFSKINPFSKLTILAFENMTIDGKKYDVTIFPPQLQELSLRKTEVDKSPGFFRGSGKHFTNLRVLILDECNWLFSSAFMPISKYKNLEILSVYKCRSLKNSVAYLSLSSHGFKSLKILDARLSLLGSGLIRAIYKVDSLLALYFHNEDISYKLDYFRRKLELLRGAPPRDFITKDDEFDVNEENGYTHEDTVTIDDIGLLEYLLVHSGQKQDKLPKSYLYLDPYRTCTCGFEDNQKKKYNNRGDNSPGGGGDDNPHIRRVSEKINRLNTHIRRCQTNTKCRRGLPDNNRTRSPASFMIDFEEDDRYLLPLNHNVVIMNLVNRHNDQNDHNDNRPSINMHRNPLDSSSDEDTDEPPRKMPRTEEPTAGPSGLNVTIDSDSSLDSEDAKDAFEYRNVSPVPGIHELPPLRPPTPHPDVAINDPPNERSALRIYYRDSAVVQIESIDENRKSIKVPLQRLSLRGYHKITDSALKYIKDLDLEVLDLTYTSVTCDGIENYLKSHPLCRIVHEKYCTCLINLHF